MASWAYSRMQNRAYRRKTDEELIEICEPDREAFGELARRYRAIAFRAAVFVLRNPLDAEDRCKMRSAIHRLAPHVLEHYTPRPPQVDIHPQFLRK